MYTIHQAKANLARLIREAETGKEVIIVRGKKPVAKLVAIAQTRKKRIPGKYKDIIKIHSSFYNPIDQKRVERMGY